MKDRKRRAVVVALCAFVALLGAAWVDGAEEPLHTIVEPVAGAKSEASS